MKNGFTLIELMIAVAIVGILAAIAVPNYQDSVRKSRRADAQGALMNFANGMERFYTESGSYCGGADAGIDVCGDGAFDIGIPNVAIFAPSGQTGDFYSFTISAMNAAGTAFTLRATPVGGGPQDGNGMLELDSTGVRRWDRNNNYDPTEAGEDSWD